MNPLQQCEVFFGQASVSSARVYVRLPAEESTADCQLGGWIEGPWSHYAHTLTAKVPLTDQGPGSSLLAAATVPDPCFWTPAAPYLYRVFVQLQRGEEVLAAEERTLGVRPLGASGRKLMLEGRNWILRAVTATLKRGAELEEWRERGAAMWTACPDEELCAEATRLGVFLVADLTGISADLAAEVRRLGNWPAVALLVLPDEVDSQQAAELKLFARNTLFAQELTPTQPTPAAWAEVLLTPADSPAGAGALQRPLLLMRHAPKDATLEQARAACDQLQSDTAGKVEAAGYVV